MADLPQNSTYPTGGSSQIGGSISSFLKNRGIPLTGAQASFTPSPDALTRQPLIPEGTLVDPTSNTQPRYQPIPEGYGPFLPSQTPQGFKWPAPNLETTQLRTMPGVGQYVVDKSQPGKIIKSSRSDISLLKRAILDGRPSDLYEVDHAVPLWAGGSDTIGNYEVLRRVDHDKKSKAEGVAYTLLANKKINENQAKFYALSWKDRDLTDIPDLDKQGLLPLATAEAIKNRWDEQASAPVKLWDWKHPVDSVKKFLSAVPDATESLGPNVREALGIKQQIFPDNPITDTIAGSIEEFSKGFASGFTAGWIPYKPNDEDNLIENVAGIAGNIAGMLLPVGLLAKALGLGVRGTLGLARGSTAVRSLGIGASESAMNVSTMIKAPSMIRTAMRSAAFNNIAVNTGALSIYMQASPQAIDNRLNTFYEALAYGIATPLAGQGFARGAGAAGLPVADNLIARVGAESLGVGSAGAAIAIMADPEHPTDALVNGGVLAALHMMMAPVAAKNAAAFKQNIQDEGAKMANNILYTYLPSRLKLIQASEPPPTPILADEAVNLRAEAMRKLDALHASGRITPEDYIKERSTIFTATSVLADQSIAPDLLAKKSALDLLSLAEQSARLKGGAVSPPSDLPAMANTIDDMLFRNSLSSGAENAPSGKYPTGTLRLSGMADLQNPYPEFVRKYFEMLARGKASPSLIVVSRPEMEPIWRGINNMTKTTDVVEGKQTPFKNPQNAAEVFGMIVDDSGQRQLLQLGWLPREFHIEPSVNSFNNRYRKLNEQHKDKPNYYEIPMHDPAMNKDTISEAMERLGLKFVVANLDRGRSGMKAVESQQPYLHINLNDENWAKSIELNNIFKGKISGISQKSVPQMISEVNAAIRGKQQVTAVKEVREKITESADKLIEGPEAAPITTPETKANVAAFHTIMGNAREALLQDTPEALALKMKQFFGMDIDEATLLKVFDNRNEMTVRELFILLNSKSNASVRQLIDETIRPFIESPLFRKGWKYGAVFPDLKVLGGLKPTETAVAPTSVAETPLQAPQAQAQAIAAPQAEVPPVAAATQTPVSTPTPGQPQAVATPIKTNSLGQRIVSQVRIPPIDQGKARAVSTSPQATIPFKNPTRTSQSVKPATIQEAKRQSSRNMLDAFAESERELDIRGTNLLDQVTVPERRNQYVKTLGNIIMSIDPVGEIPTTAGSRRLTVQERRVIGDRIKNRLRMKAEEMVEQAFSSENEITFKTGSAASGELLATMKDVIKADTQLALGSADDALATISRHDVEEVLRAAKILDINSTASLLKKAETPAAPRPTGPYSQEEFGSLNKVRSDAGKEVVENMEKTIKDKGQGEMGEYRYALERASLEGFKALFGKDYKSPRNLQIIGAAFSDFTPRGKARDVSRLFETESTQGELTPISHTRRFIDALGSGDSSEIEAATIARRAEIGDGSIPQRTPERMSLLSEPNSRDQQMLSSEDLKEGGMRLVSPTQVENVEAERLWTELYPGLHSSIVSGSEPTAAQGVRDARARIQHLMRIINSRVKTSRERYGSQQNYLSLGLMKGSGKSLSDKQGYQTENKKRTQEMFSNILSTIKKELEPKSESKNDGAGGPGLSGLMDAIRRPFTGNTVSFSRDQATSTPEAPTMAPQPQQVAAAAAPSFKHPQIFKAKPQPQQYDVRGMKITQDDLNEAANVLYGEISNRSPERQAFEVRHITNTALNRMKERGKTLTEIFQQPYQYQGYAPNGITVKGGKVVESQYQKAKAGKMTEDDKKKLKVIMDALEPLKSGKFDDTTGGAMFYVHASDGTMWLGKTIKEAKDNANAHEKSLGKQKTSWGTQVGLPAHLASTGK